MEKSGAKLILADGGLAILIVTAVAAFLRIYHLGAESLWIDEGYSLRDAADIGSLGAVRPLYFTFLNIWSRFGHSEFWLRLPSAIFGIAAVPVLYLVGRRIYSHRVGLMAALLMAISPLQIDHSQEIRMYSLITLIVVSEVLFFVDYVQTGRIRNLLFCLACVGIGFLVFPLSVFMLLAFNLFFLIRIRRREAAWWYAGQALVGVAAIPLMPKFLLETREYGEAWAWRMNKPGVLDMLRISRDFNLWRIPEQQSQAVLAGDIYGVLILLLIAYGVIYAYMRGASWQTSLCLLWLIVPLGALLVVSHVLAKMWLVRYVIYASPAYYILIALGLAAVRSRPFHGIMLAVVMLLPLARLGTYYAKPHRPEWRPAVRYVEKHLEDGDVVVVYRYGNKYVYDYYYSGQAPWIALGPTRLSRSAFEWWSPERVWEMLAAIPPESKRIWFVLSLHENTGGFSLENYIKNNYRVLKNERFDQVTIYLVSSKTAREEARNGREYR